LVFLLERYYTSIYTSILLPYWSYFYSVITLAYGLIIFSTTPKEGNFLHYYYFLLFFSLFFIIFYFFYTTFILLHFFLILFLSVFLLLLFFPLVSYTTDFLFIFLSFISKKNKKNIIIKDFCDTITNGKKRMKISIYISL